MEFFHFLKNGSPSLTRMTSQALQKLSGRGGLSAWAT
jgi:hypothetical protein